MQTPSWASSISRRLSHHVVRDSPGKRLAHEVISGQETLQAGPRCLEVAKQKKFGRKIRIEPFFPLWEQKEDWVSSSCPFRSVLAFLPLCLRDVAWRLQTSGTQLHMRLPTAQWTTIRGTQKRENGPRHSRTPQMDMFAIATELCSRQNVQPTKASVFSPISVQSNL